MRNITFKTFCLVLLALFMNNDSLNAQAVGIPSGGFFSTSSPNTGGQLGHRQSGTFGSLTTNSRWIGIGQPAGVFEEIYGMRIQDRDVQATFSLNGDGVKDLEIQWGDPSTGSNVNNQATLSTLNVNFATSNFTTTPVLRLDPFGRMETFNRIRSYNNNSNTAEYLELGHGGANAYINSVGDGNIDFRLAGANRMRLTSDGRLGIGINYNPATQFNLDVRGGIRSTTGVFASSDKRFKENIKSLSGMTEKLLQLEGMQYNFKNEQVGNVDLRGLGDRTHFGFLAQDLLQVFPEMVIQDDNGFYAVQYDALIPVLVEGFKDQNETITEQEATIEQLNSKVDELETQMAAIAAALQKIQGTATVNPSASLSVQPTNNGLLKQNRPNPFSGLTTIDYTLPETADGATLIIHNISGQRITSYSLTNRSGSIEFDATGLGLGTYVYTLLVNGEKIAQQKMIVQ